MWLGEGEFTVMLIPAYNNNSLGAEILLKLVLNITIVEICKCQN